MGKGLVVVLSGASSVGKGGIRELLLKDPELNLQYTVSMTTRPQRPTEVEGKNYYFVTHKDFAKAIHRKELLEYTEFNGFYYGTPKSQVEYYTKQGKNVLIEVEAQGAGSIKLNLPDALAFFIVPKSLDELEKHLIKLYKDDDVNIKNRLNKARMEMELAPLFENVVSNEDEEKAYLDIKAKILEELEKRK